MVVGAPWPAASIAGKKPVSGNVSFEAVQQQADAEGKINWDIHYVDGTIVRAHQHAAGSPRPKPALGRSQGVSAPKFTSEPQTRPT